MVHTLSIGGQTLNCMLAKKSCKVSLLNAKAYVLNIGINCWAN
jgi:hypothetical protein